MAMTIQEMGAVGEMIGGIAVIFTLIYLTLQIRQNTRAVRLNTGHAVTEEFRSMFELVAGNGELAELITKAADTDASINGADKVRYWCYTSNFIYAFENAYFQWVQEALDSNKWAGMKRMVTDYAHLPGFEEYWRNRKHWYSENFQHFMDTDLLQSEAKGGVPLPGEY
jgi:hypothetical protein